VIDGDESVAECGQRIFDHILRVASGERTKSEQWGFGAEEFAPWVQGATM
jgi:altronate hydrolase